ncbi:THO complex subunit 7 homolog [Leptinotarsa decemlineata]|uniref:THO complex subunit 7 homolog n=1 Tax=Leptinotarsa decemlineata TaxID=7539 RepID=UPI003D306A52
MSDEKIIRRKLMFDGDGTGDERRINFLQKMILKFILIPNDSQDEMRVMYHKICCQLSAVEHSRKKSELVKQTYDKQIKSYKAYQEAMENNIGNVKKAIGVSTALLADVKYTKVHKLNCDMIARDIEGQPSREETTKQSEELSKQIMQLNDIKTKLNKEWLNCRKQFKVITTSANQLQELLNKSDADDILGK